MLDWYSTEAKQLIKDVHKYKNEHDYRNAGKAEKIYEIFIRCIKGLHELKQQGRMTQDLLKYS